MSDAVSIMRVDIGDAAVVVDATTIREVLGRTSITSIPGPAGLIGIIPWGGRALAVLDIAPFIGATSDIVQITEHVRTRLARQICHANRSADGSLPVITLSPVWEEAFAEALVGDREKVLALPPSKLHEFVGGIRQAYDNAAAAGETPALLTSGGIRPYVRSLIERFRPQTVVMSQSEIHPKVRLKSYGSI